MTDSQEGVTRPSPSTSEIVSLRLRKDELEAIRKQLIKCPTCGQKIEKPHTLVRMLMRRALGIDRAAIEAGTGLDEEEDYA